MRSTRRSLVLILLASWLITAMSSTPAVAQDSTPDNACPTSSAEDNIELVQRVYVAINSNDADAIHEAFSDDMVHNLERYGLDDDHSTNADEVALAAAMHEFYPGHETTIEEIFAADGNRVVAVTTQTIVEHLITGDSVELDIPIEVEGITIFTIECGEIAQMHGVQDELSLLVGLGVVQNPMAAPEATPES